MGAALLLKEDILHHLTCIVEMFTVFLQTLKRSSFSLTKWHMPGHNLSPPEKKAAQIPHHLGELFHSVNSLVVNLAADG